MVGLQLVREWSKIPAEGFRLVAEGRDCLKVIVEP